jgi:hypothetical protein
LSATQLERALRAAEAAAGTALDPDGVCQAVVLSAIDPGTPGDGHWEINVAAPRICGCGHELAVAVGIRARLCGIRHQF